jgi:hypothetical protein
MSQYYIPHASGALKKGPVFRRFSIKPVMGAFALGHYWVQKYPAGLKKHEKNH